MRIVDPDFDPDNIPKKKIRVQDWKKLCPICESLMLDIESKWKCSCCGHSQAVEKKE